MTQVRFTILSYGVWLLVARAPLVGKTWRPAKVYGAHAMTNKKKSRRITGGNSTSVTAIGRAPEPAEPALNFFLNILPLDLFIKTVVKYIFHAM